MRSLFPCLRSEGGFALVEVMVSAVLLVVVSLATYPVIDQAAERSGSNRARGVAVSLAEQDQDRMRELPTDTLETVNGTTTKSSNGIVFTIGSKAEWTSDATGVVACSSSTGAAEYLRITTTVTWPKMNGIDPVVLESFVAPKLASINRGTVVLTVQKANGQPQPGIAATIQGSTKSTDSTGCALWTNLSPGTSDLTISASGYVDINGVQAVTIPTTIAAGETSSKSLLYDQAAGITTDFKILVGGTTGSPNGSASKWYDASYQSGANPIQKRPVSAGGLVPSLTAAQAGGLFPFTVGYQAYAGDCAGNDPTKYKSDFYTTNPSGTAAPAAGTNSATVTAHMKRLMVNVTKTNTTTLGTKKPHFVIRPNTTFMMGSPATAPMAGCTDSLTLSGTTTPATVAGGSVQTGSGCTSSTNRSTCNYIELPWGIYNICADDANTSGTPKKKTLSVNMTPTGTTGTAAPTTATPTINLSSGTTDGACT